MRDVPLALRDFFDPGTLRGAAFYGLAFCTAAWLAVRAAVHRALSSHAPVGDPTAITFLGQLARVAIYVVAFLSYVYEIPVLRELGRVWLTSVGLVSIVVGIAAQSTLGNLISGISLLLYRPFRIGDRLQIMAPSGLESGIVESLNLGYTTLQTDDNRRIVVPNSLMASQTSVNISRRAQRAVGIITLNLPYAADIDGAKAILLELVKAHPRILQLDGCRVSALSDSAITITLRIECTDAATADDVKSDLLESIKKRFDADGIAIAH